MRRLAVVVGAALVLAAEQFGVGAAQDDSGAVDRLVELMSERLGTADIVAAVKWLGWGQSGICLRGWSGRCSKVRSRPARSSSVGW
ncbi:hypothetical protein ACQP1O_12815 [Nocardia sp. CA-151230]|uniref:hypothetical protein n=1 Tax=Nocardia sp. CA-151230 TaxID=3239982 RepID=UPI003D8B7D4A